MDGMKIVYVFDQSIVNRENISYCLRELLYRHLVLRHRLTAALILFFSLKKWQEIIYLFTLEKDLALFHLKFLDLIQNLIYSMVDFSLQIKSLSWELMQYVFNFRKFRRFRTLVVTTIIELKKDILFVVICSDVLNFYRCF